MDQSAVRFAPVKGISWDSQQSRSTGGDEMKGPESAVIDTELPAQIRGLALVSFSMNFLGLLVFWIFPFGMCLAIVGSSLGALSIALGVRTKAQGIYFPLGGMLIAGVTIGGGLTASLFADYVFFFLK
jgi:hypothetical protein